MQKILSPRDAWADFYEWAKTQDFWKAMSKSEKRKMYDAQADYLNQRGQGLGYSRIKSILEKYAPDRYTAVEGFLLKQ